jgi:uncharacterized protein (TIGR03435 family)
MNLPRPFILLLLLLLFCPTFFPGSSLVRGQSDHIEHQQMPVPQSQQQVQAPSVQFKAASIRPVLPPYPVQGGPWIVSNGKFWTQTGVVRGVIALAYGLQAAQVRGGQPVVNRLYEFDAETEDPRAGPPQIRLALQTLLADRFKLLVHRETQQGQEYTLVIGKNGPKIQQTTEGRRNLVTWAGPGQVTFTECALNGLVNILADVLGNPVVDKTGLHGMYNFSLMYADPRLLKKSQANLSSADILRAVQEQLGLQLESQPKAVDTLVIDHIEEPTPN